MRPFTKISAVFLFLVAAIHLARLFTGVEVLVAGAPVPVWFSAPAGILLGGLGVMVWRESQR